jgi:hypothetical protein
MNWKLILPLWLFGPAMGTLVVLGVFPEGTDRYAWFVIVAATAFVCARREPERALLHAAVTGFFNGASATMIQALFLDSMVKNNPFVLEKFAGQPDGFDLEFFVFMLVPFVGVAGGAMTGLLAMVIARLRRGSPGGNHRGETTP